MWVLISLMVVACAAATQTPERMLASAGTPKATPPIHPPMLLRPIISCWGTKLSSCRTWIVQFREYQAALKADPASQSVKARLAGLYFSLGDMPNAVRYAEQAAEGTEPRQSTAHADGRYYGQCRARRACAETVGSRDRG